jgi:diketogulonate reductase-like aldo/keto reductase
MEFKKMGKSQVLWPEIGLGTSNYAGGIEPLRAGIEHGAILIDTAESYGTEEVVGKAIRGLRDRVFLATKVSPRNFRRRDLVVAAEKSLRRLGTDRIDLYQLHWPNYTVPIAETMAAMESLVDQGKVRFIGVSKFSVGELKKAQAALSKYQIVSNQVRYSLVERSIEQDVLPYCQQAGISVIAFSPLGNEFSNIRRNDPERMLAQVASRSGKTAAQVALNWLVAKDNVVVIPKASTVDHVVENCGASGWRLSQADVELLDTHIRYRRRGRLERLTRRWATHAFQLCGRHL